MTDFENGLGNWTNDAGDKVSWELQQGRYINTLYGPSRDHTIGTQFGIYFYIVK